MGAVASWIVKGLVAATVAVIERLFTQAFFERVITDLVVYLLGKLKSSKLGAYIPAKVIDDVIAAINQAITPADPPAAPPRAM